MQLPLQITIRDIPATDSLINHIKAKAEKLDKFADHIMSCRVVLEVPQKHQHNGKIYNVRIDMTVPQDEIVINKVNNENAFIAIRDAFNAAKRKLKTHETRKRGEIKNHIPLTHGKVARLFPEDEYGFIESFDGRDFYFHKNNVVYPEFDKLEIGASVQFMEIAAGEGLQANRVTAGKHHPMTEENEEEITIEYQ